MLQPGLAGVIEVGARAHEVLVRQFDQPAGLRIEPECVALVVYCFDACEQFGIESFGIFKGGEFRCLGFLNFLQNRVGVGAGYGIERALGTVQQLPALFEGDECVGEIGRCGIVRDRVDFFQFGGDTGIERGLIVGVFDLVERRRVERQRTLRIKRV